ncbi:hypothetical protein ACFLSE_02505 [Bacteroidota bacterium]
MRQFLLLLAFLIVSQFLYSQEHEHEEEHHHPELEFGFSAGFVYNLTEKEAAPGIHVHVIKTVSKSDKIGLGLGYERIFDDHKHNAASFIILYRPIDHLFFNIAPGISWLTTESNSAKLSMHIEGLYEWEFGSFHLGPFIGIAFNSEDFHASVGLHLAIGF